MLQPKVKNAACALRFEDRQPGFGEEWGDEDKVAELDTGEGEFAVEALAVVTRAQLVPEFKDITQPTTNVFQRIAVRVADDDNPRDTGKFPDCADTPSCANEIGEANTNGGVEALVVKWKVEDISLSQSHVFGRSLPRGYIKHGAGNVHSGD